MKITSVDLLATVVRRTQYPDANKPEVLIVGRSNVGKSSLINTLVNRKNYARTSSKPGKTQTINFYLVNDSFYLVDVPGYGYAEVNKEKKQNFGVMIEEYLQKREVLKHVFLLVDFRHKPTEDDVLMYNFLKYFNLPVTIIATKASKIGKSIHQKHVSMILEEFDMVPGDNFIKFSSDTKEGRKEILNIIESLLKK